MIDLVENDAVLDQQEELGQFTVTDERLEKFKNIHARLLLYVPLFGLILGIFLAYYRPIMAETVVVGLVLYFLTMLGGSVGFHRLLAHRGFKASRATKYFLIILGSMNAQGSPMYWVSNHRRHHQNRDRYGDPHSPHIKDRKKIESKWIGFVHSQITWTYTHKLTNSVRYTKDLMRDSDFRSINSKYFTWVILGLFIPGVLVAFLTQSAYGFVEGVIWGGLVRIFFTTNLTNSINSLCHLFGNRDYNTDDLSTNIPILSLVTVGESWHNNHHAFPASARFGLTRWQLDPGYYLILLLKSMGMVWDVRTPDNLLGEKGE